MADSILEPATITSQTLANERSERDLRAEFSSYRANVFLSMKVLTVSAKNSTISKSNRECRGETFNEKEIDRRSVKSEANPARQLRKFIQQLAASGLWSRLLCKFLWKVAIAGGR